MSALEGESPNKDLLIRRGLLPDNLPPLFTAEKVANFYLFKSGYKVDQKTVGRCSTFNGSKRGFQRRLFSIPHPAFVRDVAEFYWTHWDAISSHFAGAQGSVSTPKFGSNLSRSLRFTPHSQLPLLKLKRLARYKYCLVTDVSRCYPSIYTHSFPWALNGRSAAKSDRKWNSADVYGNRLDFLFRQMQDGQTVGIPVGPDISRIAGEIILSAVDGRYAQSEPNDGYIRHVDDFWIGGESIQDCEDRLHRLRQALNYFSLDANEQKTKIVPMSSVVSESWPYDLEMQLKQALDDDGGARHDARTVSVLGNIVGYSSASKDDGVIKFFLRKIDNWGAWQGHWDILEPFLAHVAIQFPYAFEYIAQIVAWRSETSGDIDNALWFKINQTIIRDAAILGRDTEVVWGLWLAKQLNQKLSIESFEMIANNNSPLVLGLLAHFVARGRVNEFTDASVLWSKVEDDGAAGAEWPLALELNHLQISPPNSVEISNKPALREIFDARLSLINWETENFFSDVSDDWVDAGGALSRSGWGYEDDADDDNEIIVDDF